MSDLHNPGPMVGYPYEISEMHAAGREGLPPVKPIYNRPGIRPVHTFHEPSRLGKFFRSAARLIDEAVFGESRSIADIVCWTVIGISGVFVMALFVRSAMALVSNQ